MTTPFELGVVQAARLTDEGLARLRDDLWPGGRIVAVERMFGGLGSTTHRVEAVTADGTPETVVLRGHLHEVGATERVCRREAATLRALEEVSGPAPRLRWSDPGGEVFGRPALATTLAPGRTLVAEWTPGDVEPLARVLAAVHALPVEAFGHLRRPPDVAAEVEPYLAPEHRDPGDPFVDVDLLCATVRRGTARSVRPRPVLVHEDFHPGNVLWDGHTATVIDWVAPYVGHPGRDVGYCRYDLTLACGPEVAGAFTDAYAVAAGGVPQDLWLWDLVAVASSLPTPAGWLRAFHEHGRLDLTAEGFEASGRAFFHAALDRAPAGTASRCGT